MIGRMGRVHESRGNGPGRKPLELELTPTGMKVVEGLAGGREVKLVGGVERAEVDEDRGEASQDAQRRGEGEEGPIEESSGHSLILYERA